MVPLQDVTMSRTSTSRASKVAISVAWAASLYIGVTGAPNLPLRVAQAIDEGRTSFQPPSTTTLTPDVNELREATGLSWQQIADAVGVSRRSVHYWANGGKVSPLHQDRLRDVASLIAAHRGEQPEQVRAALLLVGPDGQSPLSMLTRSHRRPSTESVTAVDRLLSVDANGAASDTGTDGRSIPLNFSPQSD